MKVLPILFTHKDVMKLYPNVNSFYSFLARSLKVGTIKQIKKGLYALVDPSTGTIYATKFQIACKLFDDAYFSYHDALEYYGLATQCFVSSFTYLTHVVVAPIEFEEITYYSKKSTCNLEINDFMKQNGTRLVSLERAIIDSIDNIHEAGGYDEITQALEICPNLNVNTVVKLLDFYDKKFLYQKVGYLFEKYFGDEFPPSFYEYCESKISKAKKYLDSFRGNTVLNKKWNLLIDKREKMLEELPDEIF